MAKYRVTLVHALAECEACGTVHSVLFTDVPREREFTEIRCSRCRLTGLEHLQGLVHVEVECLERANGKESRDV